MSKSKHSRPIFLFVLVGLMLLLSFNALAETNSGTWGENITWTLDEDGVMVISGSGDLDNSKFTHESHLNYSDIKSVIIEPGITGISEHAFDQHTNLISVVIPEGVTYIGKQAFNYCASLKTVTIPASMVSIDPSAFDICTSLTEYNVAADNPVYYSVDGILYSMENMQLMLCPIGKTGIVNIPSGTNSIREHAFSYCSHLSGIIIPESVTEIGQWAFQNCEMLESITLPDSLTVISRGLFGYCSSLKSITFPKSIVSCNGQGLFRSCTSLETVSLPWGIASLPEFSDCTMLKTVYLPGTVRSMNLIYMENCPALTDIYYAGSETALRISNMDKYPQVTVHFMYNTSILTLPANLKIIESEAFAGSSAKIIRIPSGVESIAEDAFGNCSELILYGPAGSAAEEYASSHSGLIFIEEIIDNQDN